MSHRNVHVLVFAAQPGDRYRAGRTLRALKTAGFDGESLCDASPAAIAARLCEINSPVWFLRAGVWPTQTLISFPNASHTGRALCALGMPRPLLDEAPSDDTGRWLTLRNECSGDFCTLKDRATRLPVPFSAYLEAPLVAVLARRLTEGSAFSSALCNIATLPETRLVHFPTLDIHDDESLRVALLITSIQQGGAERVALDLTHELPRCGVRTRLITLGSPTRSAFEAPPGMIDASRAGNRQMRVNAAAKAARDFHADVIHGHLLNGEDLSMLRSSNIPLVLTVHNARAGWQQGLDDMREGDAALLVACSRAVEADVRAALLPAPVRTVWNGIDFSLYDRTPERLLAAQEFRRRNDLSESDFVLVALANPRPQKRLERLPAVLAALQSELQRRGISRRAKLIIAGEASRVSTDAALALEALRGEIDLYNLGTDVRLIGSTADVATVLIASDALVSVSAYEGLSLAHLEALAANLPVVATNAGGTAEIAQGNPDFSLVPLDAKPVQVAEVLASLAEKPRESSAAIPQSPATDSESAVICAESVSPPPSAPPRHSAGRASAELHFTRLRMAEQYARLYPRAIVESESGSAKRPPLFPLPLREGVGGGVGHAADGNPSTAQRNAGGLFLIANNFSTGGAQSSARRLLLGMKAQGIRVRAAVLQEQENFPTPGRRALLAENVPVLALPPAGRIDPALAIAELLEHLDADPPQAILLWNVIAEYKVLLAEALFDTPLFDVSPGEMNFSSLEKYFARPRPGLPCRSAAEYGARIAGAVVKYPAEVALAEKMLQTRVHVVPNGVPLADSPCEHAARDPLVIGTAARISPQKKLDELIDALRLAAPKLPPHVLRIAGGEESGSEGLLEQLKQRAEGLNIEWLGELSDTRAFLNELDIFAMISEPAGCPNASLEAMAAGLPVIATDVGGARDQIDDGVTGRIVPRGDVQSFAEALVDLAHNLERRKQWGAAAYERARTLFSIERMVADYRRVVSL
jgi:glycosyltransferase involved in cell wall biosynthesis